jgi:hypothetical protein
LVRDSASIRRFNGEANPVLGSFEISEPSHCLGFLKTLAARSSIISKNQNVRASFHEALSALGKTPIKVWGATLKTSVSLSVNALSVFLAAAATTGYATSSAAQTPLPSVTVDAPAPRVQSRTAARSKRSSQPTRRAATAPARGTEAARTETAASKGTFQQGNGPI